MAEAASRRGSRADRRGLLAARQRAALMPYLMGGFPDLGDVAAGRRGVRGAAPTRGARRAVLGSARGRAGDPGRGAARAGGRRDFERVLERGRGAARDARPGGADVLREPADGTRASTPSRRALAARGRRRG